MSPCRILGFTTLGAFVLTAPLLSAPSSKHNPVWGQPINGLKMSISLDATSQPLSPLPSLTLFLKNVGSDDLNLNLGGGGWREPDGPQPNAIKLILRDSAGNSATLMDHGPGPPYPGGGSGGGWILSVPVPVGETYSVPLKFDRYKTSKHSSTLHDFEPGWEPGGTYTLQALFKVNSPRVSYPPNVIGFLAGRGWAGSITSNKLKIRFPNQ